MTRMRVRDDTPIMRVIARMFVQSGKINYRIFKPKEGEDSISAFNGDMISPEEAYLQYTNGNGGPEQVASIGAGIIFEFGLDIDEDGGPNSPHVSICYGGITDQWQMKAIMRGLASNAVIVYDPSVE